MSFNIVSGSFTSDGNARTIAIPSSVNYFYIVNRTVATANAPAGPTVVRSTWQNSMANGFAITERKLNTSNTLEMVTVSSDGFTLIDDADPGTNAAIALANPAFTQADPAVWMAGSAHGLVVGDICRVTQTTAARQYAGLDLSVTAIGGGGTTFTSLLDTTAITQATAGFVRKLNLDTSLFYPRRRFIAEITVGTTTVVRLTVRHEFVVGEKVQFVVPTAFGMSELNGLTGTITAIDSTLSVNTITVDIDSSSFTAFAFPASASVPFTFAQVVPVGEISTVLTAARTNVGIRGIRLGTSVVGVNADVMDWYGFTSIELDS